VRIVDQETEQATVLCARTVGAALFRSLTRAANPPYRARSQWTSASSSSSSPGSRSLSGAKRRREEAR